MTAFDTVRPRPPEAPVAAVVLAAGRSSRMGAFKPLMPFGDTTVVGHAVETLRAAGITDIRVVIGHNADLLRPVLAALGVRAVLNPDYDLGMFSSIRVGIASLPETVAGTLLLPVDVPLVRAATFAEIAAAGVASEAAVVHPTFRGERGHPPFLARRLFADILDFDGDGGLAALLGRRTAETTDVAVIDRGILHDMDHLDDHSRLATALAHRHVPEAIECAAIHEAAATSEAIRRHCLAVSAFATAMAERLVAHGVALDVDLVRAAGLLHDVAKGHPRHAEAGADLLCRLGYPAVAGVIAAHMDLGVVETPALDAAEIVHLADKLVCEEHRVTLDERFSHAFRRFNENPEALAGARRRRAGAEAVLHAVEALIDLPDEVLPRPLPTRIHVEARIS
jgi:molybdenum cofactor cytidylyltransferase